MTDTQAEAAPYDYEDLAGKYERIRAETDAKLAGWYADARERVFPARGAALPAPRSLPHPAVSAGARPDAPPVPSRHERLPEEVPSGAGGVTEVPRPAGPATPPRGTHGQLGTDRLDTHGGEPGHPDDDEARKRADEAADAAQARSQALLLEAPGVSAEDLAELAREGDGRQPEPVPDSTGEMTAVLPVPEQGEQQ